MTNPLTPAASIALAIDTIDELGGAFVFPIAPGAKSPPCIKNNLVDASNDPEQIKAWVKQFTRKGVGPNWGVALKKSKLFTADVDTNQEKGKVGAQTYADLDDTFGFPKTFTVTTPSGGFHKYYRGEHVFALGRYGLGPDIDSPNYVLAPGCVFTDGTSYRVTDNSPLAPAPEWFYDRIKNAKKDRQANASESAVELDKPQYIEWAIDYLKNDAEPAIEGKGGEQTTFKVAASLRDNGISQEKAVELMMEYYNIEFVCEPLWEADDLARKIGNAYSYASLAMLGGKTAEADFSDPDTNDTSSITPEISGDLEKKKREKVKKKIRETRKDDAPDEVERTFTEPEVINEFIWCIGIERAIKIENPAFMLRKSAFDGKFMYLAPKKGRSKSFLDSLLMRKMDTIRRFDEVAYLPGKPKFLGNGAQFNCYTPSTVVPAEGDISWWEDHLAYLFPDPVERAHVLNWMAWLLQNLSEKPKHALLIQGHIQGTGKSFLSDMLTQILNPVNVYPLAEEDLHNQFNGWAMRSKMLVIEELRAVERGGVKSKLHNIITQERISVNEKNLPQRDIVNCFGIFAMTNDDAAIALDNTDRRYLVIRTDAIPRDKPEFGEGYDPKYYDVLYARLKNPVDIAAVAYSLMNRDLQGYDARNKAPETAAKREMINSGMTDLERWFMDAKTEYPLNGRVVSVQDVIDTLPKRLERVGRLHASICGFLKKYADAVEAGQFKIADGSRPRLYFINKTGLQRMPEWRKSIASVYEADKQKAGKPKPGEEEPNAAEEFGVGGEE